MAGGYNTTSYRNGDGSTVAGNARELMADADAESVALRDILGCIMGGGRKS